MAVLQVQVETERNGTVAVRAKAAPGREMDSRPIAGFYVRRRFEGDVFKINDWKEFSPRWMEFVETPPNGWQEQIDAREQANDQALVRAEIENNRSPREQIMSQMFSMASLMGNQPVETINQATGKRGTLKLSEGAA